MAFQSFIEGMLMGLQIEKVEIIGIEVGWDLRSQDVSERVKLIERRSFILLWSLISN